MRQVIVPAALLVTLAVGQQWDFELVDTASHGDLSIFRHPDGRMLLAYARGTGEFALVWKDSVWNYENTGCPAYSTCAIGVDGTIGIAYRCSDSFRLGYAVRTESGWQHETLPWRTDGTRPWLGIGPTGQPGLLHVFRDDSLYLSALLVASRTQDSWRLDTVRAAWGTPGAYYEAYGFAYDTLGFDRGLYREWLMMPTSIDNLYTFGHTGGRLLVMGFENYIGSAVLGLDPTGRWAALYSNVASGHFDAIYYQDPVPESGVCLDSSSTAAAVGFDTAGRPHALYLKSGQMHYCWRWDTTWRWFLIPRTGVIGADFVMSDSCQPVVAFSDARGVWLAHGTGIVGAIAERPTPQIPVRKQEPTILYGASGMERLASCVVFDALGRRVLNPRSGVYFVRDAQAQVGRKVVIPRWPANAVRKVVSVR
jgi:hypothetical protein